MATLLGAMTLVVAGCGGGGSSASATSTTPVAYSGNTSPATISATNASALSVSVIGSGDAASVLTGLVIEEGPATPPTDRGVAALGGRLAHALRSNGTQALLKTASPAVTAQQVDFTDPCDGGIGTVRTLGTLDDSTLTGTLTLVFSNCRSGTDALDGQATLRVDAFDQGLFLPTDATYSFAVLTLRGSGLSVDLNGTLRVQLGVSTNRETLTSNIVVRDNLDGVLHKTENLVTTSDVDNIFFPQTSTQTISGRVYHSQHGYVDVATLAPLGYISSTQLFPGSGELQLRGSGNTRIVLRAVTDSMVDVALDLDGDTIDETVATLTWIQLSGPASTNLADSDGDGMHDSWETSNGLSASDPTDGALNRDGDGANNRKEYDMATDPNDPAATPPAVDIAISLTPSATAATVGGQLSYSIVVTRGSHPTPAAYDVVVTSDLPAGTILVSATPERGSCSGTTTLTCRLGDMVNTIASVNVSVVVAPTISGQAPFTVILSTRSFDPNPANDSATATTAIGIALTGIQALIDQATQGETIHVPAGTYVGALDFGGKNIALRSVSGAAATTIHGSGQTAVRMGPEGVLSGFTITGSSTAIETFGTGSVITNNIIAGNAAGLWPGIIGNTASPIIERNLFRANACDTQFVSGVVVFLNESSPRIANNVFTDNPCQGVNLPLPSGPLPVVVNNTFIRNRTAIRVDLRISQAAQTYRNNLIAHNEIGLEAIFPFDLAPVWTNNLVFGNTTDYVGIANQTGIAGNLAADPLLADVGASNYHLLAGSPAIDAGSATDAPGDDFEGTPRPQDGDAAGGAAMDIGAFEASPQ